MVHEIHWKITKLNAPPEGKTVPIGMGDYFENCRFYRFYHWLAEIHAKTIQEYIVATETGICTRWRNILRTKHSSRLSPITTVPVTIVHI
jgi:hypothetical protein